MCFTETWLHDNVPDTVVNLAGFQLVRADRSCNKSGKKKVAVYVNNRWYNPGHITLKERVCSLDIELLAVSLHPESSPRPLLLLFTFLPGHCYCCLHSSRG